MTAPTRIYRITVSDNDRLVRAVSPASALMFVARDIARVQIATQDDLVDCLTDGIRVETAGEEAPRAEPMPPLPQIEPIDPDPAGMAPGEATS